MNENFLLFSDLNRQFLPKHFRFHPENHLLHRFDLSGYLLYLCIPFFFHIYYRLNACLYRILPLWSPSIELQHIQPAELTQFFAVVVVVVSSLVQSRFHMYTERFCHTRFAEWTTCKYTRGNFERKVVLVKRWPRFFFCFGTRAQIPNR